MMASATTIHLQDAFFVLVHLEIAGEGLGKLTDLVLCHWVSSVEM